MQAQGQFKGSMWILSVARTNMTLCWLWWQELYNKKKQHKTSKGEVEDKNFVKKYCVFCSDVCQLWRLWSRLARLRPVLFPGQVSIGPFRLESCRMHLQHVCTSIYIYTYYIYIYDQSKSCLQRWFAWVFYNAAAVPGIFLSGSSPPPHEL